MAVRRLSWRGRLLLWFLASLGITSLITYLVARLLLLADVDRAITAQLRQEAREFVATTDRTDPVTGEPVGADTRRLLELHLERTVPARNETFVALIEGQPALRSIDDPPVRLDRDRELVSRWAGVTEPTEGTWQTAAGAVRWLAIPVVGDADGTFVVASFVDLERAGDERAVLLVVATQLAAGAVLLLSLGRVLTRGLSRPIERITAATRAIQATDLSARLDIEGDDELAGLAATIDGLLERLEAAVASQRRFVAEASHELRTPITIIQGHLDVLDEDPSTRAATLAVVHDELDRMAGLVSDLLTLASAQQLDFVRPAAVDLDELAERVRARVVALAERDWSVEADDGTARVDADRVIQAVLALVDNAVRHTGEGGAITIELARRPGVLVVRVGDDGPGIPAELLPRVFERFERGGARTDGAGLGLSIVRAIVAGHGGTVTVERTGPDGTIIAMTFPDHVEVVR